MNISSNNSGPIAMHNPNRDPENSLSSYPQQLHTSQDCTSSMPTSSLRSVTNSSSPDHQHHDGSSETGPKQIRMKIKLRNETGDTDETRDIDLVWCYQTHSLSVFFVFCSTCTLEPDFEFHEALRQQLKSLPTTNICYAEFKFGEFAISEIAKFKFQWIYSSHGHINF